MHWHFKSINSLTTLYTQFYAVRVVPISILEKKELRPREVNLPKVTQLVSSRPRIQTHTI